MTEQAPTPLAEASGWASNLATVLVAFAIARVFTFVPLCQHGCTRLRQNGRSIRLDCITMKSVFSPSLDCVGTVEADSVTMKCVCMCVWSLSADCVRAVA